MVALNVFYLLGTWVQDVGRQRLGNGSYNPNSAAVVALWAIYDLRCFVHLISFLTSIGRGGLGVAERFHTGHHLVPGHDK